MTDPTTEKPESNTDHPVFAFRTNSNNPGQVTAYPAIHLSRYEMGQIVWCEVNGIPTGCVR